MCKMVCTMVNPEAAKKVFRDEEELVTENSNFEADIKAMDPKFDVNSISDLMGDEDGRQET